MLAAAPAGAVALGLAALAVQMFGPSEASTIDTRFSIRGTQRPSGIVIVGIDASTLKTLAAPPVPRRYDAQVINHLVAEGARTIAVDLAFIRQTDTADDNILIEAVKRAHGAAVLASIGVGPDGSTPVFGGTLPSFGARAGFAGIKPDSDGVLRSFPYSSPLGEPGCCLDSLAVATVEEATHRTVPRSEFPGGRAPIDFAGPPGTFPEISFARVVEGPRKGHYPAGLFRGKIVVVGTTDARVGDVHATSVGAPMSGAEVQANAIWTVMRGNPLQYVSWAVEAALIVLLASIPAALLLRLRVAPMLAATLTLGAAYAVATQLAFNSGTVIPVLYPLLALAIGTALALAADQHDWRMNRSVTPTSARA